MSALTEYLGQGHVLRAGGREYPVSLLTQAKKAEYEARLFARHREAERALRDCYAPEEYSARLDRLATRYRDGDFALDGVEGLASVKTPQGMLLLVSVLLSITEGEAVRVLKQAPEEIGPLVGQVLRESYALTDEEWAEAQAQAEAAKKAPGSQAEKNAPPA